MTSKLKDMALKPIGRSVQLPLAVLVPSEKNRDAGTPEEIRGLAKSIVEVGLLYPLIVRKLDGEDGKYEILAGARRFKALSSLEVESVHCIVVSGDAGERGDIIRVVENHQRLQLDSLEEAAAVRGLLDLGWNVATVARSLGRSKSWVSRRSSLTELSERWVQQVKTEVDVEQDRHKISLWPPSHLEIIARFPAGVQDRMLDDCAFALRRNVPSLSELIAITGEFQQLLGAVPWALDDATLFPEAGACDVCPKRSSQHLDLFPEELPEGSKVASNDRCLDTDCWDCKAQAFVGRRLESARREHPTVVLLDASEEGDGEKIGSAHPEPLIHSSEAVSCRKSDEDAVAAVVVCGPGMGRIKYIRNPLANGNGNGNGRQPHEKAEIAKSEEPAVRSLEERKEAYDKRRRQIVIDAVRERLTAITEEDDWQKAGEREGGSAVVERGLAAKTIRLLVALLSLYGWKKDAATEAADLPTIQAWQALSKLRNHDLGREECQAELLACCWHLARLSLRICVSRLTANAGVRENEAYYREAEIFCTLLGFDLVALRATAAEKVPYAKAWSKEVTDDWAAPSAEKAAASAEA